MKGTEALALALRRSADRWYAVPGYPVSGLAAATGAAITTNEKVALEYALGDSLSGRRAAVIVKHVGLNACADPLVHATAQGLRAGVVIVVGDDIRVTGSDVAGDSRYYGEVAWAPVFEPDGDTLGPAVEAAFEASETFSRAAILRVTPDLLDADVRKPPHRATREGLADPGLRWPDGRRRRPGTGRCLPGRGPRPSTGSPAARSGPAPRRSVPGGHGLPAACRP